MPACARHKKTNYLKRVMENAAAFFDQASAERPPT
jgi:hypothetical protein